MTKTTTTTTRRREPQDSCRFPDRSTSHLPHTASDKTFLDTVVQGLGLSNVGSHRERIETVLDPLPGMLVLCFLLLLWFHQQPHWSDDDDDDDGAPGSSAPRLLAVSLPMAGSEPKRSSKGCVGLFSDFPRSDSHPDHLCSLPHSWADQQLWLVAAHPTTMVVSRK